MERITKVLVTKKKNETDIKTEKVLQCINLNMSSIGKV